MLVQLIGLLDQLVPMDIGPRERLDDGGDRQGEHGPDRPQDRCPAITAPKPTAGWMSMVLKAMPRRDE